MSSVHEHTRFSVEDTDRKLKGLEIKFQQLENDIGTFVESCIQRDKVRMEEEVNSLLAQFKSAVVSDVETNVRRKNEEINR